MRAIIQMTRCGIVAALALFFVAEVAAQSRQQRGRFQNRGDLQTKHESLFETRDINVPLTGRQEYYPPCTGGDREFGGNGPIMNFRTRVYCDDGRRVYRQIFVSAYETLISGGFAPAPSSARGWSRPQLVYTAPAGWTIKKFRTTDDRFPEHFDRSHVGFSVNTAAGNLIYYGDTKGDDIGRYTRCNLLWRSSIDIKIRRRRNVAR